MPEGVQQKVIEIILEAKNHASEGLRGAIADLEGLKGTMGEVGLGMTLAGGAMMAAGVGIGGALAEMVKQASSFDTMITQIQNNTTMTDADVGQMRDTIMQLGTQTGSSFDALGQGFMHVVNLTGDASTAMEILKVANESAVSTGGDVEHTANILANVMHEYGADVSHAATEQERHNEILQNASHYMGVMHLAAAEANMTLEQFNQSGGQIFAWAANLGVPIEEASAAFATMTKHGFDAAEAGTQVKDMFEHLIHPAKASVKELERLSKLTGVDLVSDFTAAGLHSKGLTGVLGDLHDAFTKMGMSEADQTAEIMKLIPNIRGGVAAFTLLGTGASDYAAILGDLNNKTKVDTITQESFARTQETLGFQMKVAERQVQALAITLGQALMPAVQQLLTQVTPLIQQFSAWATQHADLIVKVAAAAAVILTLAGAFLTVAGIVTMVIAVLNPVGLAIGAIVVAAGLLAAAWATNWMGIRDITAQVVATITQLWAQFSTTVAALATTIATTLTATWTAIRDAAVSGWTTITTAITDAWTAISQRATDAWGAVTSLISDAISTIVTTVRDGVNALPGIVQDALSTVVGWFQWLYDHNYYFQNLVDFIATQWRHAQSFAGSVWSTIGGALSGAWSAILSTATSTWTQLTTAITTGWTAISTATSTAITAVTAFITTGWTAISTLTTTAWNGITTLIATAWSNILAAITAAFGPVTTAAKAIWDAIATQATAIVKDALDWGSNLIGNLVDGIKSQLPNVEAAASAVASAVSDFLGFHSPANRGPGSSADTWGPNLIKMFGRGMLDQSPTATAAASTVMSNVSGEFDRGRTEIESIGSELVNTLTGKFNAINGEAEGVKAELASIPTDVYTYIHEVHVVSTVGGGGGGGGSRGAPVNGPSGPSDPSGDSGGSMPGAAPAGGGANFGGAGDPNSGNFSGGTEGGAAFGAIVTRPTRMGRMLTGEGGEAEAILPISALPGLLRGAMGGGGRTLVFAPTITGNTMLNPRDAEELAEALMVAAERKFQTIIQH